jgi:hypothetical protein
MRSLVLYGVELIQINTHRSDLRYGRTWLNGRSTSPAHMSPLADTTKS